MRELVDIWYEAVSDPASIRISDSDVDAYFLHGIKIKQYLLTKEIEIVNCAKGGSYYKPLSVSELGDFYDFGWKIGAYMMAKQNYKDKLDLVEHKIQLQANKGRADKQLKNLKAHRTRLMLSYTNIVKKLKT